MLRRHQSQSIRIFVPGVDTALDMEFTFLDEHITFHIIYIYYIEK